MNEIQALNTGYTTPFLKDLPGTYSRNPQKLPQDYNSSGQATLDNTKELNYGSLKKSQQGVSDLHRAALSFKQNYSYAAGRVVYQKAPPEPAHSWIA